MTYFKKEVSEYTILDYSTPENLVENLQKYGVAYFENGLAMDKFSDLTTQDSVCVLDYNDEKFVRFKNYLPETKFLEPLKTLGDCDLVNICMRYKDNTVGTDIHIDNHTLLCLYHKVNYLMFWAPMSDLSLDQGSMFFIHSDSTALKKLLLQKSFNEKVTFSKYGVEKFYKSSEQFRIHFPQIKLDVDDIQKYNLKIYTKPLKRNDVVVFKNDIFHGAFDCFNFLRRSFEFRLSLNMKKIDMPNLKNLPVEKPQSYVNEFDNRVLEKLLF
jgi:ectoine hydroxylase-related dioxygenase (phytanoyl-CoA dioxygenase family)